MTDTFLAAVSLFGGRAGRGRSGDRSENGQRDELASPCPAIPKAEAPVNNVINPAVVSTRSGPLGSSVGRAALHPQLEHRPGLSSPGLVLPRRGGLLVVVGIAGRPVSPGVV